MTRRATALPGVLVVSPCVPDARGGGMHQRAWRMIEAISSDRAVTLAARPGGPMHVSQWRRLATVCAAVRIVPHSRSNAGPALQQVAAEAVAGGVEAAVALDVSVWPVIADLGVPRVLNLAADRHRPMHGLGLGWLDPILAARTMAQERAAAAGCEALVIEDRAERRRFIDLSLPVHLVPSHDLSAWLDVLDAVAAGPRLARIDGEVARRRAA